MRFPNWPQKSKRALATSRRLPRTFFRNCVSFKMTSQLPFSAEEIVQLVNNKKSTKGCGVGLVEFLHENHPCYEGKGTGDVEKLRGYILACFATTGFPTEALQFVVEELQVGLEPYSVAAAAHALTGARTIQLPCDISQYLLCAFNRMQFGDRWLNLDVFESEIGETKKTTVLLEILYALQLHAVGRSRVKEALNDLLTESKEHYSEEIRLEIEKTINTIGHGNSQCGCSNKESNSATNLVSSSYEELFDLSCEDQSSNVFSLGEFILDRPSVISFFYTKCMNPEKCSATISKLATVQSLMRNEGLETKCNIAAISYDPGFDTPKRMKVFGEDRGILFSKRMRMLRTKSNIRELVTGLNLSVGYGPVTVNRHQTELFFFDPSGAIYSRSSRKTWTPLHVVEQLKMLLNCH